MASALLKGRNATTRVVCRTKGTLNRHYSPVKKQITFLRKEWCTYYVNKAQARNYNSR